MRRTACQLLVISSAVLWLAGTANARTRPRYGDTLRAEMQTVVMSGDSTPEALDGLAFETLVTIDDSGHLQPALATSWTSSNNGLRWEFELRHGVTFHDGTPLNPSPVVETLSKISNQPWRVRPGNNSVIFESDSALPNLPAMLSLPQFAISAMSSTGEAVGTGPFQIDRRNGPSFTLKANDDYWGGRPFIDALELLTSRAPRDQQNDFSFDRADVIGLAPEQLRRAQQDRLRLGVSRPAETLFVVISSAKAELRDVRVRQAISLAIDREAIHSVIFQHQGETASGLLPNWLSGYEFLFESSQDLTRARQLRMEVGQTPAISIGYDPGDPTERVIAERIALNAHDIGLNMQAVAGNSGDLRIRSVTLPSLDPAAALSGSLDRLGLPSASIMSTTESLYASERAALQTYEAIPLVHLPRVTMLKDRVRDWSASPAGEWQLDRVWLAARNARVEVHP